MKTLLLNTSVKLTQPLFGDEDTWCLGMNSADLTPEQFAEQEFARIFSKCHKE
jgi:hypothetical protein